MVALGEAELCELCGAPGGLVGTVAGLAGDERELRGVALNKVTAGVAAKCDG